MKTVLLTLVACGLLPPLATAEDQGILPAAFLSVAHRDPVERRTEEIKGTGYSRAEAESDARMVAQWWIDLVGARSYRVLGKSVRLIGDIYVCTLQIEYYVVVIDAESGPAEL
jgi:hypothetical protein